MPSVEVRRGSRLHSEWMLNGVDAINVSSHWVDVKGVGVAGGGRRIPVTS